MNASRVFFWNRLLGTVLLALFFASPGHAQTIDYPASTPLNQFTFNGDARPMNDGTLQLTSVLQSGDPTAPNYDPNVRQSGSFFFNTPVNVAAFSTTFRFRLTPWADRPADAPWADGITFTIQNKGVDALGGGGSFLGYAGTEDDPDRIQPSVALKFKTFALGDPDNGGDPSISTVGVLVNGQDPTGAGIGLTDLLQFGPDFDIGSGDPFRADVGYANSRLTLVLTNERTGNATSFGFAINLPAFVGGNGALVGFTGGTGLFVADQRILSWRFDGSTAPAPAVKPTITSLSPISKTAGSATFPMTIRGAGFVPGVSVAQFDNTRLSVVSATATEMVVTVPASLLTGARRYNVIAVTSGRFSNAVRFDVVAPNPPPSPAPVLQIVGTQRSGRDPFSGRRFVIFLLENRGTADVTGIQFSDVRLYADPTNFTTGTFTGTEPGGTPPGNLFRMAPGERLICRFEFNTDWTSGAVSVAGTSSQGRFNAGTRFVQF